MSFFVSCCVAYTSYKLAVLSMVAIHHAAKSRREPLNPIYQSGYQKGLSQGIRMAKQLGK